jgi:formamidopyrimidine-DNA glycosylase
MPELPEVEVCRRGLQPEIEGAVCSVRWCGRRACACLFRLNAGADWPGSKWSAVRRRGKYLLIDCRGGEEDGCLIIHLGMSGNLRFVPPDAPPGKHDHVDFLVFAGQTLRFADPRRFGVVLWQALRGAAAFLVAGGARVEPLAGDLFTATGCLRRRAGVPGRSSRC